MKIVSVPIKSAEGNVRLNERLEQGKPVRRAYLNATVSHAASR